MCISFCLPHGSGAADATSNAVDAAVDMLRPNTTTTALDMEAEAAIVAADVEAKAADADVKAKATAVTANVEANATTVAANFRTATAGNSDNVDGPRPPLPPTLP